jgi:hypothetical protein
MAWEGTLGFRKLWRSRARPAAAVDALPDIYSLASDETYRGGYLITEEPDSPDRKQSSSCGQTSATSGARLPGAAGELR